VVSRNASAVKRPPSRFKVGDIVEFLFGAQLILGQITENRGPIGVGGRRFYNIRIDEGEDGTVFELPEEDLFRAAEADIKEWHRSGRTTAVYQTATYRGDQTDARGMPSPFFHYLIVAKPGSKPDSADALVISLSEARSTGIARGPQQRFHIDEGGPTAALKKAEDFLDLKHRDLSKAAAPRRGVDTVV
jgi:hypothetical protein